MIVYTIVSPLVGWLGDRYSRRILIAGGVGLWSVATVGTAFSQDFNHMFFWRALLGIGEASYGVIAPTLLADLFEPKHRGRAMGLYFLALPLGGRWDTGSAARWPTVGVARLVLGRGPAGDPGRRRGPDDPRPGPGASEGHTTGKADRPRMKDYLALFRTPTFLFNTAGMAAVTFATGAYAAWGSTFYQTVRGMTATQAGVWIGGLTAAAGLIGIAFGTWMADFLLKFTRRAYLLMASAAVVAAVPLGTLAILDPDRTSSLVLLFFAMVALASVLGPCNTVTANVVPANQRAAGYALSIFLIHLFGDISSPILIGYLSDLFGKPSVAGSPLGQILAALGAEPVGKTNLTVAMLAVVPVLALGFVFFLLGSRHLPEDMDRARKQGGLEEDFGGDALTRRAGRATKAPLLDAVRVAIPAFRFSRIRCGRRGRGSAIPRLRGMTRCPSALAT